MPGPFHLSIISGVLTHLHGVPPLVYARTAPPPSQSVLAEQFRPPGLVVDPSNPALAELTIASDSS